jgi:hypothetical protein
MSGTPKDFQLGALDWPGLGKLGEECGELGAVVGKIVNNGGSTINFDGTDLRVALENEIADVLAICEFLQAQRLVSREGIERRTLEKLDFFSRVHVAGRGRRKLEKERGDQ